MHLKPRNLHYDHEILDKFKVHLVQIGEYPEKSEKINCFDYFNNEEFQKERVNEITEMLEQLDNGNNFCGGANDIVVFPELVAPYSVIDRLQNYAKSKCFIVCGMFYNKMFQNNCVIIDPSGKKYIQHKLNPSPDEPSEVHEAHRRLDQVINVFVNTPIGDFAVLICYEFSNPAILDELRGKVDNIIVISMNKSADSYLRSAKGKVNDYYCHIFLCNIAQYGNSAVCGPFIKDSVISMPKDHIGTLSAEINLKEFRRSTADSVNYRKNSGRRYSALPAHFERVMDWWKDTPENCIESRFSDWERMRADLINSCKEIVAICDENITGMKDCEELAKGTSNRKTLSRELIRSIYLLEDLKEQASKLLPVKEFVNSGDFFSEQREIIDLDEFRFHFKMWDDFMSFFGLDDYKEKIKKDMEDVAKHCVTSCENYGGMTKRCNFISMKIGDTDQILITSTSKDKSILNEKDVVVVGLVPKDSKIGRKDKIEFYYTNMEGKKAIFPSLETYLGYKIHKETPGAKAILHFHHDNIVDFAWEIPIIYKDYDNSTTLSVDHMSVPSVNGRNVKLVDITEKIIDIFKNNPEINCVIGVRHGAWTYGNSLAECLKNATNAEEAAARWKIDPEKILQNVIKLNKEIEEIWATKSCKE